MNPSPAEILEAIEACPGREVLVLPNNSNVIMAAKQAAAESPKRVEVVETITVPHGVAAALAYNATRDLSENMVNLVEAAEAVTVFEITKAARESKVVASTRARATSSD